MTKDKFEQGYAARSGTTVDKLHEWGMFAEPCVDCDYDECEGWKMGYQMEDALFEDGQRARRSP